MAIIKSPIFKDINESEISEMTAAGFLRARKFRKNSAAILSEFRRRFRALARLRPVF